MAPGRGGRWDRPPYTLKRELRTREKERGSDDQDQEGEVVNLKLAKHRNGPTGEIQLWFRKRQTRFVSYAADRYAEAT